MINDTTGFPLRMELTDKGMIKIEKNLTSLFSEAEAHQWWQPVLLHTHTTWNSCHGLYSSHQSSPVQIGLSFKVAVDMCIVSNLQTKQREREKKRSRLLGKGTLNAKFTLSVFSYAQLLLCSVCQLLQCQGPHMRRCFTICKNLWFVFEKEGRMQPRYKSAVVKQIKLVNLIVKEIYIL